MKDGGDLSSASLRPFPPERYKEFSRLGEGSMGVVYLALDTELNRRVALKMIRTLGSDAEAGPLEATPTPEDESFGELEARFLQEAWVTGGLEHPGIVPVYELGKTTGGVPYYTMRLVRGERTLADAIEAAKDLDERLALLESFLKVCDAIRYAHARGVIHRDLKPSNIALGNYGETVVLDWGLAKLKDQPDTARSVWQEKIEVLRDETDLATLASAVGTPGYMSPEAALVDAEAVDERSDVYSLGAILYRILTGKLPYEFRSYSELLQRLTTRDPTPPVELDAAVPGGLSAICVKALSTSPGDRYGDADEMSAAIRSWQTESALDREVATLLREAESALDSAPQLGGDALLGRVDRVTAVCARILELRPDDEQAQQLLRDGHEQRERAITERERVARKRLMKRVAVVGLLTATAAILVVAVLLDAKRREAEEARSREEAARARAEDLANFMLYDLRDGLKPIGRLDLLDDVALKSKAYYESLPSAGVTDDVLGRRSSAFANVGSVLEAQGNLDAALQSYRDARAIYEGLAERNPTSVSWKANLAICLRDIGDVISLQGDLDGALQCYEEAHAISRRLADRDPESAKRQDALAIDLHKIGNTYRTKGKIDKALEYHRQALAIRTRNATRASSDDAWQHGQRAVSLVQVGDVLSAQGDLRDAERHYLDALSIRQRRATRAPSDVRRLDALRGAYDRVGNSALRRGAADEAVKYYRDSLAVSKRLAESDPTHTGRQSSLAHALVKLAYALSGDGASALAYHREALEIRRRLAAGDPTNTSVQRALSESLDYVGGALATQGKLEEALAHRRESLAVARRLVESDPSNATWQTNLNWSLDSMGRLLSTKGDLDGALESYREALGNRERLAAQAPTDLELQGAICTSHHCIGWILQLRGDLSDALEHYRAIVSIAKPHADADPSDAQWQRNLYVGHYLMGSLFDERRDLIQALEHYRKYADIVRALATRDPSRTGWRTDLGGACERTGRVLSDLKRHEEAERCYRESLAIREDLARHDASNTEWQRNLSCGHDRIGMVLQTRGDTEGALASFQASLAIRRRLLEAEPANTRWRSDLAWSFEYVGGVHEARGDLDEALNCYRESVAMRKELVKTAPSSAQWLSYLCGGLGRVAAVLEKQGAWKEATGYRRAAMETHVRAVKLAPHLEKGHAAYVDRYRATALIAGDRSPEGASDYLALAYARYDSKEFLRSARRFAEALEDEKIRADISRANLYNAACSAALASARLLGAEAAQWRKQALAWLADDLRRRREDLGRVDKELAGEVEAKRAGQLRSRRKWLLEHFEHARTRDPDLASLRGTPEFAALFAEEKGAK